MRRASWLYAIVDLDACAHRTIDPLQHASLCVDAGARWLQLRAKTGVDDEHLALAMAIAGLCEGTGTSFVMNDRVALAVALNLRHVHLGQGDASAEEVRSFAPKLRIGRSTHDLSELEGALRDDPEYVAFGPVFETRSKRNPEPTVGLLGLERAHRLAQEARVPLVAIGGIDSTTAAKVKPHCEAMAFISGLFPAPGEDPRLPFERLLHAVW
jgi:thiamine-phosphate pyrophosphorylase